MIKLIWAMDKNWLIGKDDLIPWHIKEDLLYYKSVTNNQTVLMGEVTYYSLKKYYKNRDLPYGKIYVASLNELTLTDAIVIKDLDNFLKDNTEDLYVVGGSTIYKIALPYADMLYISFIKGEYEGNRYFPKFDLNKYELIKKDETDAVIYTVYKKIL